MFQALIFPNFWFYRPLFFKSTATGTRVPKGSEILQPIVRNKTGEDRSLKQRSCIIQGGWSRAHVSTDNPLFAELFFFGFTLA